MSELSIKKLFCGLAVHLLDHGASGQSNMDDVVRRIRRLPGNLPPSGFPDSEVFAAGHDGCDFMLTNPLTMPMVLERMLQNKIPEHLQISSRDVLWLTGEIKRFVQHAIVLRQKRLPVIGKDGRYIVNSFVGELMRMMRFV